MNLKDKLHKFFSIRWVQHSAFWLVFILPEIRRFSTIESEFWQIIVLFECLFFALVVSLVYLNLRYFIPKYWNPGHYSKYAKSIVLSQLTLFTIIAFFAHQIPQELKGEIELQHPAKIVFFAIFRTNIYLLSSSLFHFVKEWIDLKDENLKFTAKAQEQLEAELNLLKGQVNPHFLFNTLNNIYSMSLYDSKKTPDMILKLSHLLSYMIYECKDQKVSLEKEIDFIQNYIQLEQVRMEDTAIINLSIEGKDPGHLIPPLLFIPFIENTFKHGVIPDEELSTINITLKITPNDITLITKNAYEAHDKPTTSSHKGFGIKNVTKRLDLLFPEKYKLEIEQENSQFISSLKITL